MVLFLLVVLLKVTVLILLWFMLYFLVRVVHEVKISVDYHVFGNCLLGLILQVATLIIF